MVIEEKDYPLRHDLKLVALQGDCNLRVETSASGGEYVVASADNARAACLRLIERARAEDAHLALVPEMVIPEQAIADLIAAVAANPQPLILIGGIEGIAPSEYRALVARYGGIPDIPENAPGTYVNAMLVVVRTSTDLKVFFRAKRFASGPENAGGPQLVLGASEFLVLKLGPAPFVVVPVICSEFVWPELWDRLAAESAGLQIDLVPVLQRNHDIDRRHWGPVIHTAYQRNLQMRFVLANQGLSEKSDGTCFVAKARLTRSSDRLRLPEERRVRGIGPG
jgi:predicted amidohydrolase